jgi:SAM-dependent methyltransferase
MSTLEAGERDRDMTPYFRGDLLWGDDMNEAEVDAWYEDERLAYFSEAAVGRESNFYDYHALNRAHGYQKLPQRRFGKTMSFGGANGEELRPFARNVQRIVVVEPADYPTSELEGTPVEFRKPLPSGALPAADGEFELLTCLGALHHVPTVTRVVGEFARVLAPGGFALVREPIVSMGDWRQPRRGLTKRERGIPRAIFEGIIQRSGFRILHATRCVHPFIPRIGRALKINWFNSPGLTRLDALLSAATPWSTVYHPQHWWRKLQPAAVYFVLQKPAG